LERLTAETTYLGHSSSPVRVCLRESGPSGNLFPREDGDIVLRVPSPGRLERLEEAWRLTTEFKEYRRIEPPSGRFVAYGVNRPGTPPHPLGSYRIAYMFRRDSGPEFEVTSFPMIAERIHKALISLTPNPPEELSGHRPDGSVTSRPHMAVVPLPNIGHTYAHGQLMGFALLLPRDLPEETCDIIEQGVALLEYLQFGSLGEWRVSPLNTGEDGSAPVGLRRHTYMRPCRTWWSVTPVVFGHFPREKPGRTVRDILARSLADVGLPEPIEAGFSPVSKFIGVPPAKQFQVKLKQATSKLVAHVYLKFAEPVSGPILAGAGRFRGLGWFRPVEMEGDQ
ncbi:MAG: type I-U CRISPR-associated protein Cas5/Cas6, partial [Magnetococcales bacterium]|nr:type I-U CRISPR-associated protein Cas5/Cas6 [Magnetococcales bacterium]